MHLHEVNVGSEDSKVTFCVRANARRLAYAMVIIVGVLLVLCLAAGFVRDGGCVRLARLSLPPVPLLYLLLASWRQKVEVDGASVRWIRQLALFRIRDEAPRAVIRAVHFAPHGAQSTVTLRCENGQDRVVVSADLSADELAEFAHRLGDVLGVHAEPAPATTESR